MGIPTSDGPDFIVHRLRTDVTTPWTWPLAGFVAGVWLLFALVPYLLGDASSGALLLRWTVVALVALGLTFAVPALLRHERHLAAAGAVLVGVALAALVWGVTG